MMVVRRWFYGAVEVCQTDDAQVELRGSRSIQVPAANVPLRRKSNFSGGRRRARMSCQLPENLDMSFSMVPVNTAVTT